MIVTNKIVLLKWLSRANNNNFRSLLLMIRSFDQNF